MLKPCVRADLANSGMQLVNLPWCKRNWILKGMGEETLISFLHVMPKTNPLLIKSISTTLLDHAPGVPNIFSVITFAKVDSDTI